MVIDPITAKEAKDIAAKANLMSNVYSDIRDEALKGFTGVNFFFENRAHVVEVEAEVHSRGFSTTRFTEHGKNAIHVKW